MNVPVNNDDPNARSDEFLLWLYEQTLNDPEYSFYGFDEAWYEAFGADAKSCFDSLKKRQFFLYKKSSNSYGFGRSSLPTPVGLNKKAITYAEKLKVPKPKIQPEVKKSEPTEPKLEKEPELEKDVAWFIYNTTGNMRTALNYLADAKIYLNKEPLVNRTEVEEEIRERGKLGLEIVVRNVPAD